MNNKKATIYDYARMCKAMEDCFDCPARHETANDCTSCEILLRDEPDKANEIILKWCKEHPVETRQDKFLKMFPKARVRSNGVLDIAPCSIEKDMYTNRSGTCSHTYGFCDECTKDYWLAEVDENE